MNLISIITCYSEGKNLQSQMGLAVSSDLERQKILICSHGGNWSYSDNMSKTHRPATCKEVSPSTARQNTSLNHSIHFNQFLVFQRQNKIPKTERRKVVTSFCLTAITQIDNSVSLPFSSIPSLWYSFDTL